MKDKWIKKKETTKQICWMNTLTGELKYRFFTYPDGKTPLPKGWDRRFSNSNQKFYYKYIDAFGKESFTFEPPKKLNDFISFSPRLQDMPYDIILTIIKQIFTNYPLEFSDTVSSLIVALPTMEIIKSSLDVQGTQHIFNLLDTNTWIRVIVSMGFDILSGEFKETKQTLWNSANINYQQMFVQECRYTSRSHDLLDLKHKNNSLSQAATILLDKLKEVEETDEGKAFLNGDIIVKKIDSDFEHKDIQFLDIRHITDLQKYFYRLRENINLKYWDTSRIQNMESMFNSSFADVTGLENWNTSNVTNMSHMFSTFQTFNCDISRWDTTKVKRMDYMFFRATNFNQSIGNWNTQNITNMEYMFNSATSFNQPIGNWNTSNVTNMESMFKNTTFNQPIGNWNTSNVENMNSMFEDATSFNQPIGNWNTSNVKSMESMFEDATSFRQPIDNWNTNSLENIPTNMFIGSGMILDIN